MKSLHNFSFFYGQTWGTWYYEHGNTWNGKYMES